ncbi:MAG: hypothetical protein P1U87_21780 [Verrucomicrobiales bacterium]|nr:hypothetical protein [Verrucomicrobiales bacterium]
MTTEALEELIEAHQAELFRYLRFIGGNRIDLIAEKRDISLTEPLAVSIDSSGNYRDFETLGKTISPDASLDSYLLHFCPGSLEQVRGVIRFDQPIVVIL